MVLRRIYKKSEHAVKTNKKEEMGDGQLSGTVLFA